MWRAITEPSAVTAWFGTLTEPVTPGAAVRLDFDDGDYFDVVGDSLIPLRRLAYRWRFLGVGPEARITWQLSSSMDGTVIVLDDHAEGRPASEVTQLKAGWLDFLERLDRYLTTGEPARYGWRSLIDGGVQLPANREGWRPLRGHTVTDWMPIATEGTDPRWFFVVDDDGPRRFAIRDWDLTVDRSLSFAVAIPQARATTRCAVTTTPTDDSGRLLLNISHDGWTDLGLADLRARGLRHRFAAAWAEALRMAAAHADRPVNRGSR
ncbi:hypothetical protein GCM10027290_63640 [Micromonospora sonneratiae]